MHAAAFGFVQQAIEAHPPAPGLTVEIGGKDINGSIRPLFREPYVSIDVAPGPGVDVIADGSSYTPPEAPTCVVCCEVLEHAISAHAILHNAREMLQSGGLLIVTAAGVGRMAHSAIDGGPLKLGEWYANVDRTDLRRWLDGFTDIHIVQNVPDGDIYATAVKP